MRVALREWDWHRGWQRSSEAQGMETISVVAPNALVQTYARGIGSQELSEIS